MKASRTSIQYKCKDKIRPSLTNKAAPCNYLGIGVTRKFATEDSVIGLWNAIDEDPIF